MPDDPKTTLLELAEQAGPTITIALNGELDPATAPVLDEAIERHLAEPAVTRLVLDLAGLTFLDSSGLRVFVTTHQVLSERGGELVLRSPSDNTKRLLDITGLGEIIAIE